MKRAAFLAGGAALAGFPSRARSQTLAKLRVSGSPDNDIVGALWGQQSGIFRKLGLDVEVTATNSGGVITAAVLGGSLEIGKGNLLDCSPRTPKGVPLVVEAPASLWNTDAPTSALVVAKGSRIRSGADLNGKTVSVPALGDLYQIAIGAWIDQRGGDSRTVRFLELPHRAAAEAIASGRVDCANIAEPILSDALAKRQSAGHRSRAGRDRQALHRDRLLLRRGLRRQERRRAGAFPQGSVRSGGLRQRQPDRDGPHSGEIQRVDAKIVASMTPTTVGVAGQLDPRMIQPIIDAAVKYKVIPAPFPAKDLIDPNALAA